MHIALIFSVCIATLIKLIYWKKTKSLFGVAIMRTFTSQLALAAMQDIFLAYNMFFILDVNREPDLIRDEGRRISYAVMNVIDMSASVTSLQDDSEQSDSSEDESDQSISYRMFDQFLRQEGLKDRNSISWSVSLLKNDSIILETNELATIGTMNQ